MNQLFQKNQNLNIIVGFMFILGLFITDLYGQKRRPERSLPVEADSLSTKLQEAPTLPKNIDESTSYLPVLDLKEHTITGEQQVEALPSTRITLDRTIHTTSEENPTKEGKANRSAPGAGGEKDLMLINKPEVSIINEFHSSYGSWNDILLGVKLRKQYVDDELFTDINWNDNSGHIDNAEFQRISSNLINIHRFSRNTQNKSEISLNQHTYNMYGAQLSPDEKRTRFDINLNTMTEFRKFNPMNFRVEGGVHYLDPDNTQLFNWNVWGSLNWSGVFGSTYINSDLQLMADRIEEPANASQLDSLHSWIIRELDRNPIDYIEKIRDDIGENILLNEQYFGKFSLSFERLVLPRLHVQIGGVYFQYRNDYNPVLSSVLPYVNEEVGEIQSVIFPTIGAQLNLGRLGTFFIGSKPGVKPDILHDLLTTNQYMNLAVPVAFEEKTQNIHIGWRRSSTYDLSFEVSFDRSRISSYGVFEDIGNSTTEYSQGRWRRLYGNIIDLNVFHAMLNWKIHPRVSFWAIARISDASIFESSYANQVPYLPEFTFEYSLQASLGYGYRIVFQGISAGDRYASAFQEPTTVTVLDPYFIQNLEISKLINNHFEIFITLNNILDETYELWQGYESPGFSGYGGIKLFW
jgi:hypothetical protein